MDLLPGKSSSFRNPEYWRHFYSSLDSFEWYVNFTDIESVLYKIIYEKSHLDGFFNPESLISYEQILDLKDFYRLNINTSEICVINIGSGNSLLALELEKINFKKIISIDFEQSVINSMKKYENNVLKWLCIDVSNNEYLNLISQLNDSKILLDKAFLDAYISKCAGESDKIIRSKAKFYLSNSISKLNIGDIFIIISLLQPYIAKEIIRNLIGENILVDLYPIVNSITPSNKIKLIPYVIAIYKIDYQISDNRRCRIYGISGVPSQYFSPFELLKIINEVNLNYYTLDAIKVFNPGRRILFHVDPNNSDISYSIAIYDSKLFNNIEDNNSIKNAVIIVPPGYEQSQLFSTCEGNEKLCNTSKCDRIIIVSFDWLDYSILQYDYQKLLQRVKSDLNPLFLKLSTNDDIPIMTCEDDVKIKRFVARIPCLESYILIRDLLTSDFNIFTRQLIFNNVPHTIQSEVSYKLVDNNEIFLFQRPCLEHHLAIILSLFNTKLSSKNNCLKSKIAILGVNVLSNVINSIFDGLIYYCVDIDHRVIDISDKYFGNDLSILTKLSDEIFTCNFDGNMINIHGDAIEFIDIGVKYCKNEFGAIILDINSDGEDGITCPNIRCISDEFLINIVQLLDDFGLFIVNVISNIDGRNRVIGAFIKYFKHIKIISIPEVSSNNID